MVVSAADAEHHQHAEITQRVWIYLTLALAHLDTPHVREDAVRADEEVESFVRDVLVLVEAALALALERRGDDPVSFLEAHEASPPSDGPRGEALEEGAAEGLAGQVDVSAAVARRGARALGPRDAAEGTVSVSAEFSAIRGEADVRVRADALEDEAELGERGAAGVLLHGEAVALLSGGEAGVALEDGDSDAALLEGEGERGAADARADDRDVGRVVAGDGELAVAGGHQTRAAARLAREHLAGRLGGRRGRASAAASGASSSASPRWMGGRLGRPSRASSRARACARASAPW